MKEIHKKILAALRKNPVRIEVAKQLGVSAPLVTTIARRHGIPKVDRTTLHNDDAVLIEALLADGMSRRLVCEKFECTHAQLKFFCEKHAIDLPDGRKEKDQHGRQLASDAAKLRTLIFNGTYKSVKVQKILELGVLGKADTEIQRETGLTMGYIRRMLQLHKVRVSNRVMEMQQKVREAERQAVYYNGSTTNALIGLYGFSRGKAQYWQRKVEAA